MVQIVALAIFTYQMTVAVEKFFSFTTLPTEEAKDFSESKLPTLFVCPRKGAQRFKNHGYSGYPKFLIGQVNNNTEFVSWEGLNNLTYKNITRQMFDIIKKEDVQIEIKTLDIDNAWVLAKNTSEHFTPYDSFCSQLDLNLLEVSQSAKWLTVRIKSKTDDSISSKNLHVIITYPHASPVFKLNSDSLKGDAITADLNERAIYQIRLEEVHRIEQFGECTNYEEGAKYQTYADCVADEQEKVFRPILGCAVPWMAGPDHRNICTGRVTLSEDNFVRYQKIISQIIENVMISDPMDQSDTCLQPCLEVKVSSKLKDEIKVGEGRTIDLNFHKTVKVTKFIKAYDFFDLVVDVGSSLGLWIGLSALGIFDLILGLMSCRNTND